MSQIHTPRLILVPLEYAMLQQLLVDPAQASAGLGLALVPNLVSPPVDRAIQIKLAKMQTIEPLLHSWFTYWLIVITESGIGVGMAGFKGMPDDHGQVEIGYGIHPDFQNRGYITEVVQALVDWAFARPTCRSVTAETLRENIPSQRVLEKAGFRIYEQTGDAIWWILEKHER